MIAGHAGEALAAAHAVGELLAVAPVEEGFVVVEVELRGAAGLEEVDDAFGFSCEVRKGGGGRRGREGRRVRRGDGGGGGVAAEKVGEGEFYGKRVGFSTTFTIKRSEFGMTYGVDKNVLGDDVTLMIDLELVQAK